MKKIILSIVILLISINTTFTYNNYVLTKSDLQTVSNLVNDIENIIAQKGNNYRNLVEKEIYNTINGDNISDQTTTILEEVYNKIVYNSEKETTNNNQEESDVFSNYNLENIEINNIINNWFSRNNKVRKELGLDNYTYNHTLESSALTWSNQALKKGEISHQRNENSSFYNYDEINERFSEHSVICENIDGITHTENIRWGGYSCTDLECTDELNTSVKKAFDNYMSEKGTENDPHYRSLVQEHFNSIGIGIQIDPISSNYYEYYLTIHYCTNLQ